MPLVTEKNNAVILLPIWPRYCEMIFSGEKKVELRKTNIPKLIEHVVVYETAPKRRIIGYFDVQEVIEETPTAIWRRYRKVSGVSKPSFDTYYKGVDLGRVIRIAQPFEFIRPITLEQVGWVSDSSPQSFSYVSSHVWQSLQKKRIIKQ